MPSADALPVIPSVTPEQLSTYDVPGPRYTSYPTVPEWSEGFTGDAYGAALARSDADPRPLSIYVHIPFCWSMCAYCGCNVIATKRQERADPYLDLIEKEVALVAARLPTRRRVAQLHLGGGTPTFLSEAQFERLWSILLRHFELTDDAEVCVEVHPGVTRREQLVTLSRLGVNRLSFGVQDTNAVVQDAIGRHQTYEQTRTMLDLARGLGFGSINFDLIYGLPHQDTRTWARTLDRVLELAPDRLAVYSFAYLPRHKPHQRRLPADALPEPRSKIDLFRQTFEACTRAGYQPVGMDHFAAPHDRLAKAAADGTLWRNFQGYTVQRAPDSVAFGVSGISDIGGVFAMNPRRMKAYAEAVEAGRLPTTRGIELTAEDQARRALITDLMCNLKVDLGPGADEAYATELDALVPLAGDGLVDLITGPEGRVSLRVTPLGRLFLRNVAMPFDARLRQRAAEDRPRFSRTV